jgi:glycerophosphoryl diester phosphodiesterase
MAAAEAWAKQKFALSPIKKRQRKIGFFLIRATFRHLSKISTPSSSLLRLSVASLGARSASTLHGEITMKTRSVTTLFASLSLFSSLALAKPWLIGHRADEVEHTQNSMEAFIGAEQLNADFAEMDLRYTNDHVLIVHHDPRLNRTVECGAFNNRFISQLNFAQLQTCHFKKEKSTIPTFNAVLQRMKSSRTGLLIELKENAQREVIQQLASLDPQGECAKADPHAEVMNRTFQCFSKTMIMSFTESWMEDIPALLKSHPELRRVRLIKLVPPSHSQKMLLEQNAHYWNLDGVGLELHSLGENPGQTLLEMQKQHPHQLKLIWSGDGKMDFSQVLHLPLEGIVASDIRGLIDFATTHPN